MFNLKEVKRYEMMVGDGTGVIQIEYSSELFEGNEIKTVCVISYKEIEYSEFTSHVMSYIVNENLSIEADLKERIKEFNNSEDVMTIMIGHREKLKLIHNEQYLKFWSKSGDNRIVLRFDDEQWEKYSSIMETIAHYDPDYNMVTSKILMDGLLSYFYELEEYDNI